MLETEYNLVNCAFSSFLSQLTDVQYNAQMKWDAFKQQRESLERKVQSCVLDANKKIQLDIGGTVFSTTESTLLREKETFFWALLNSNDSKPDDAGKYFVDRSANVFGIILEFLRAGKVCTDHLTRMEQQMLRADIEYYGIHSFPPFTSLKWNRQDTNGDDTVILAADSHTLIRTKGTEEKRIYKACSPVFANPSEVINWRVTVKFNGTLDQLGGCSVGILNNPVVAVRNGGFLSREPGCEPAWDKFVEWPQDCAYRVLDFSYDNVLNQITVSALNQQRTVTLSKGAPGASSTEDANGHPVVVPIVVCSQTQNVSFTIELL